MTLVLGFDLESTGVKPEEDRIVEVGAVMMELETGVTRMEFERRCNPGIHIPSKAVDIHGITDADVLSAPPFAKMASGLMTLFQRADLVVWHNGDLFDGPMLFHEVARAGIRLPEKFPPTFDTMLLGRGCTPDGKAPSLGELCFALDVPYDPALAHGALYDIQVMLRAFRRGWQLGVFDLPEPLK